MKNLSLKDATKELIKLETEIDLLKNNKFSKFLNLNIKIKERKLNSLINYRNKLISSKNLLKYFKNEEIKLLLGSRFITYKSQLFNLSILREHMVKNWGYLVPNIHILDTTELLEDEFEIVLSKGAKRQIFKIPKNYPQTQIINYLLDTIQTHLFDNVSDVLDLFSMYDYANAAIQNLPSDIQKENYCIEKDWMIWGLHKIVCALLKERYCILNINFIVNTFLELYYNQNKNIDYVINELEKALPKYPEKLFTYDWVINSSQEI